MLPLLGSDISEEPRPNLVEWHRTLVAIEQHAHFVITYACALNRFHCITPSSSALG